MCVCIVGTSYQLFFVYGLFDLSCHFFKNFYIKHSLLLLPSHHSCVFILSHLFLFLSCVTVCMFVFPMQACTCFDP